MFFIKDTYDIIDIFPTLVIGCEIIDSNIWFDKVISLLSNDVIVNTNIF